MSFLEDKCTLFQLSSTEEIDGFSCGDSDLDEFFTKDCFAYAKELLGKTYCYKLDEDTQNLGIQNLYIGKWQLQANSNITSNISYGNLTKNSMSYTCVSMGAKVKYISLTKNASVCRK